MEEIYNPNKRNKLFDLTQSNNIDSFYNPNKRNQIYNMNNSTDEFNPNKRNKNFNIIQPNNDVNLKINSILSSLSELTNKINIMEQKINTILNNQEQFIISKKNEENYSDEIFRSYLN